MKWVYFSQSIASSDTETFWRIRGRFFWDQLNTGRLSTENFLMISIKTLSSHGRPMQQDFLIINKTDMTNVSDPELSALNTSIRCSQPIDAWTNASNSKSTAALWGLHRKIFAFCLELGFMINWRPWRYCKDRIYLAWLRVLLNCLCFSEHWKRERIVAQHHWHNSPMIMPEMKTLHPSRKIYGRNAF